MITVQTLGIQELERSLGEAAAKLPREVSVVINKTARWTTTQMSRQIREELAAKAKDVKKQIRQSSKSKPRTLRAVVTLHHEKRLSLKAFGARQTRKGVSARTRKKGPRTTVPGGFMGPRPGVTATRLGGHAYKRTGPGRTPIVKLHGASPWGAYVVNKMRPETEKLAGREFEKQLQRRIRFNVLKRSGLV